MLGVTYKTAWFMSHRIREAFRDGKDFAPMGGDGQPVEIDETFIGGYRRGRGKGGGVGHKDKIMSIVERGGKIRSFHVASVGQRTLRPIIKEQVDASATVYTDEASYHRSLKSDFAKHEAVDHRIGEYVRGDVYTNTLEGYFSILKRGLGGIYQHVSAKHLKRYVGEFDFRYNTRKVTDIERTHAALAGIEGKRLYYKEPK
jgi:transposase-like protein